jgi:ribonuclease P protein component
MSSRRGPLVVFGRPNGLDHPRLGLSIGRRAGNAVRRNAIKRRVREAFRHLQHDLDRGYDLVVTVKQHAPMPMQEYQALLQDAASDLMRKWARHETRGDRRGRA